MNSVRLALIGLAAALFAWNAALVAPPASAQDRTIKRLMDDVGRLGKDVRDLQMQIYREGQATAQASPGVDVETLAARIEVRIGELDGALGALTGRVEAVAHNIDQLTARLDKLVADVDFRLTAIEQAQTEAAKLATATPPPPAPVEPLPAGSQTLGTIPAPAASTDPGATTAAPPPATLTPALPPGTPQQQYDYAFSLLRQADYGEAERALKAFIELHPDDALTGNAYYWLAETFYVRGRYEEAVQYFARGYQDFPDSVKAPDNLLKLGMSLGKLDRKEDTCLTFAKLDEQFPNASPSIKQRVATESQRAGCG